MLNLVQDNTSTYILGCSLKYISLILAYVFFAQTALAGLPPTTAAGLNQSNVTTFNFKVPNNQATPVTGGTLLENGNKNILVNSSFEHNLFDTGWTMINGSASSENIFITDGRKSMLFTSTGTGPISIRQDSTLYNLSYGSGRSVQGVASVKILTDLKGIFVCPRRAGVSVSSNYASQCYTVQGNNTWETATIPFLMGGTSNGIEILSTSAVTGTIYLDEAFVGAVDVRGFSDVIGPWVDYGPITITATTTNPTKATTRQQDNVRCRIVGQSYECEFSYRADSATGAAAGSGDYLFNLPSGIAMDSSIPFFTTVTGLGTSAQAAQSLLDTTGWMNINTSSGEGPVWAYAYSENQFRLERENA